MSAFTGDVTEMIVGSKTLATAFFIVDVKGCYDLLGSDWIHANGCVPSTLHQCIIQWVGNDIEVVRVEEAVYVATTEAQSDHQDSNATCLSGKDLSNNES
jgi:hypothetical protein